jgi:uncharacterized protein (TIGR03086 family)
MLDLKPATHALTELLAGVRDDQLIAPTPCADTSLGALIDHVDGLALAFAAAASKTPLPGGSQAPSADASRLGPEWRMRIPQRLTSLADAWTDPQAWTGVTQAGGLDLPGEVAGLVAINEVLVHSWDVARATGQDFHAEPQLVEAAYQFVQMAVAQNPDGTPGLFGPPVTVADEAPLLDRLIGLTGRAPDWSAA